MSPANLRPEHNLTPTPAEKTSEPSDRSLLHRIQGGEEEAATQLYFRYAHRLMALAKANTGRDLAVRFDPEDVVQSVFRTFFRRATVGCYDVPAGGELWRLLLVLALNKVRALAVYHRADKRNVGQTISAQGLEGVLLRPTDGDLQPVQILDLVIHELLEKLPPAQRQIIELRIEGRAVNEIAEITQRAKRTVERVLQTFREDLSRLIDVGNDEKNGR